MVLCGSRVPAWHGEEGFWSPHGAVGGGGVSGSLVVPWGRFHSPHGAVGECLGP